MRSSTKALVQVDLEGVDDDDDDDDGDDLHKTALLASFEAKVLGRLSELKQRQVSPQQHAATFRITCTIKSGYLDRYSSA
jgi:hypothetical protein